MKTHCCQAVEADVETSAAAAIAGEYSVAVEAETAKAGKTWKAIAAAVVAAVAVATSVAAASVIVGLRYFAAKFEILAIAVVPFVTCFVAITVMKIAAIEFVAAAGAVRD